MHLLGRNEVHIRWFEQNFHDIIMHEFAQLQSCKLAMRSSIHLSKFLMFLTIGHTGPMSVQAIYPFPSS